MTGAKQILIVPKNKQKAGSKNMKLIAGNSNPQLAQAISDYLDVPLTQADVRRFSDNEIFVEIMENIRGEDCFFIQSTSFPANDHLMELLIAIDAMKRGSARRIDAASARQIDLQFRARVTDD